MQSKKKGLSLDEKRVKVLEIFHGGYRQAAYVHGCTAASAASDKPALCLQRVGTSGSSRCSTAVQLQTSARVEHCSPLRC